MDGRDERIHAVLRLRRRHADSPLAVAAVAALDAAAAVAAVAAAAAEHSREYLVAPRAAAVPLAPLSGAGFAS